MIGRVHDKLIHRLFVAGFRDVRVTAAKGHWRTSGAADVHRWDGTAIHATDDGIRHRVYSWDTMTDCAYNSIEVSEKDKGSSGFGYEISAARNFTDPPVWKPWDVATHRPVRTWPPRLVWFYDHRGWYLCNLCGREHRVWIARDEVWRLLPGKLRRKALCTGCFRKHAPPPFPTSKSLS